MCCYEALTMPFSVKFQLENSCCLHTNSEHSACFSPAQALGEFAIISENPDEVRKRLLASASNFGLAFYSLLHKFGVAQKPSLFIDGTPVLGPAAESLNPAAYNAAAAAAGLTNDKDPMQVCGEGWGAGWRGRQQLSNQWVAGVGATCRHREAVLKLAVGCIVRHHGCSALRSPPPPWPRAPPSLRNQLSPCLYFLILALV